MTSHPEDRRLGVWLLGARGGLATTIITGARLVARGLASTTGLLLESEPFSRLPVARIGDLVFGGHEIRRTPLVESALAISRENATIDREKLDEVLDELEVIDRDIVPGTLLNCGPAIRKLAPRARRETRSAPELVAALQADLEAFRAAHGLERVVVVNLASTEPPLEDDPAHGSERAFARLLKDDARDRLRASLVYAWAAVDAGHAFINFTPNAGSTVPAIIARAERRGVPIMGNDGKTGETLVKSALAPMFAHRNLKVLSWQGYNILGDRDGQVLADRRHKQAKVASKDAVLGNILGYPLHTHVGIDYVPSLGDLKTAWDFVHFAGFLDYRMSLQFTWQGCDSILAAPLVLDMVRLADLARRRGEAGLMPWLASYFKSPVGVSVHDLHRQFRALLDWVEGQLGA